MTTATPLGLTAEQVHYLQEGVYDLALRVRYGNSAEKVQAALASFVDCLNTNLPLGEQSLWCPEGDAILTITDEVAA